MKCRRPLATLAALALLVALAPRPAGAASNDIRWGDCGAAGAKNVSVICTAPSTPSMLLSLVPPYLIHATGFEAQVTLTTGEATPPFWEIWPGGCSDGRVSGSFEFTAVPVSCVDPWQGRMSGSLEVTRYPGGAIVLHLSGALPPGEEAALDAGTEYVVARLTVDAPGLEGCAGCAMPVCFVLDRVCLTLADGAGLQCQGYHEVGTPWCVWQDPTGDSYRNCALPVPARGSTWGAIKIRYR